MHHVALDRAGAHDRDLDDDVVERPRFQPRQHRHLRSGFDLKRADRIGLADHRVGVRILRRHVGQVHRQTPMLRQQIETAPHATQHAQPENIHFHEAQGVDVVLVPFDGLAVDHAGGLDRHQLVQPVLSQNESTGVLRQMPGKADQRARQVQSQPQPPVFFVEMQLRQVVLVAPMRHLAGQRGGDVLGQPHGLADIAHRAASPVADDGGAQRRTRAAIGFENPLDHLLPPLVLEIHVDIRRFLAGGADEALEQQAGAGGVDRCNA